MLERVTGAPETDMPRCGYCAAEPTRSCRACTRPLCDGHVARRERGFCDACEAEWQRGGRRRTAVVMLVAGAILATGLVFANQRSGAVALWMPCIFAVIGVRQASRIMLARFKPRGLVPRARARRD